MSVFDLLAEWADRIRELPAMGEYREFPLRFTWEVRGPVARLRLDELGGMYSRPAVDNEGKPTGGRVLVVVPPPPALDVINALHGLGWKRTDRYDPPTGMGWTLTAYLVDPTDRSELPAQLRVSGYHMVGWDDPDRNGAIPYFADPPPPLGRGRAHIEAYRLWEYRCRTDFW